MKRQGSLWAVLLLVTMLGACTTTSAKSVDQTSIPWKSPERRIVLIEPDLELGELTAGGLVVPRADWTQNAKRLTTQEATRLLRSKGVDLVAVETLTEPRDIQISKLHGTVGQAILIHLYNAAYRLPSKGKALDWTLGPGTRGLRDRYRADYGLFLFVRDSYTTTGRVLMMLGAAALGVGIPGGQQVGFASLVDLNTGNIVWFNLLVSQSGDLRTEAPARKVVDHLVGKMPL